MNIIRKIRRRFTHSGIKIWNGNTLYRYACRHSEQERPYIEEILDTTIPMRRSQAWMSRITDRAVEKLLDSGNYTEKNILAILDPYRFAPLTALLVFTTKEVCRAEICVPDSFGFCFTSEEGTRHRIPVFGLRAGMENRIRIRLYRGENVYFQKDFSLTTAALPALLENMIRIEKKTATSKSPLTFVYGGDTKFPYAFDEMGEIRYYLSKRPKAYGLFPLSGGRFLFLVKNVSAPSFGNPHSVLAYEMDCLGRVYREYYIPAGIHHDGCEMTPGGNILTASSSMTEWVEDAVIEIDRQTGEIVNTLVLGELLSKHPYFDYFDWAHINTVSYLVEEHAVVICARNLHSVLKVDWNTKELLWIFCDTAFWKGTPYESFVLTPVGDDMAFSYQAHAAYQLPSLSDNGKKLLIIYDNHWHARRPMKTFDKDKASYVRIYEIDEAAHTVSLLQNYASPKSKIRSNGVCTDDRVFVMSGFLDKPVEEFEGMISEHDRVTGRVLNRYMTYNSFYRAYPFFADYNELQKPMAVSGRYLVGTRHPAVSCPFIPTETAQPLPAKKPSTQTELTRKKVRKADRIKAYQKQKPVYDRSEDLAEITIEFYDSLLFVGCRDHLIEKVFFCGDHTCYVQDYTDTEQKKPELFEEFKYFMAIPTERFAPDHYTVYIQNQGELFHTGRTFTLH